jgi:hypothetical protein
MPLVLLQHAHCATVNHLNQFEKKLFDFWGTESSTNKQYLQTQSYRTFRIHVLLNMQHVVNKPLDMIASVSCQLSDNYFLKFSSCDQTITLTRLLDLGSEQRDDAQETTDSYD